MKGRKFSKKRRWKAMMMIIIKIILTREPRKNITSSSWAVMSSRLLALPLLPIIKKGIHSSDDGTEDKRMVKILDAIMYTPNDLKVQSSLQREILPSLHLFLAEQNWEDWNESLQVERDDRNFLQILLRSDQTRSGWKERRDVSFQMVLKTRLFYNQSAGFHRFFHTWIQEREEEEEETTGEMTWDPLPIGNRKYHHHGEICSMRNKT